MTTATAAPIRPILREDSRAAPAVGADAEGAAGIGAAGRIAVALAEDGVAALGIAGRIPVAVADGDAAALGAAGRTPVTAAEAGALGDWTGRNTGAALVGADGASGDAAALNTTPQWTQNFALG